MERKYRRQLRLLADAVKRSAQGDEEAARDYVCLWYQLGSDVLEHLRAWRPDAVVKSPSGELLVVEAEREPMDSTPERLFPDSVRTGKTRSVCEARWL